MSTARVLEFLEQHAGQWFGEEELVGALGISDREVSSICQRLLRESRIRRELIGGSIKFGFVAGFRSAEEKPAASERRRLAEEFETHARRVMARVLGAALEGRGVGRTKRWDMVSADGTVVGDAKYFTYEGHASAEHSTIAEHVWLLEKVRAREKFLVFGGNRATPEKWLERYGHLLPPNIRFYFLDLLAEQPELLHPALKEVGSPNARTS